MERLTERTGEGQAIPRMNLKHNGHQRCMERLARYEETGLTPEEIMDGKLLTGWIPVTDRLPDIPEGTKDEDCPEFIVTIAGAEKPTSLKYDPEGTWFDDFGNVYSVYAWMPMPEAYRIEY